MKETTPEKKYFKLTVITILGIIILAAASALVGFFVMIRGAEITVVPDVKGMQLEEALVEIQDKGLNSLIQLKYSQEPGDKGTILEQKPNPGSILRAGSKMTLSVSRGAVIDKVGDYRGWDLQDLRSHFMSMFSTYGTLITIKEPVITVFNEAPEGTILEQKPLPDTPLTAFTELELVVSRGAGDAIFKVPDFREFDFMSAMLHAAQENIPFAFSNRAAKKNEPKGVIVSQTPTEESEVPAGTMVQFVMTTPETEKDFIFGILERTLPDYPVSVTLSYEIINPKGERNEIFSMKHKGGVIAIPYLVETGSTLILSAEDKELVNFFVR